MTSRLHHQFKLAAPILGPLSILVFLCSLGIVLSTRQVSDGLDELTATLTGPQSAASTWLAGNWIFIAGIALVATTTLAIGALRHLHAHKKRMAHLERIAFWSGVVTVPMAYLLAPAVISLPLVVIFGVAAIACIAR
jgi:hypothetical protein